MATSFDQASATRSDRITFKQGEGIDTTSLAYDRQMARWELTNALRGGSDAMRDDGAIWLAMEDAEQLKEYRARLSRTYLLSAYDDALEKLVAKPFSRDVELQGEDLLSDMLAETAADPDMSGGSVTTFFRQGFDAAVDRGLHHVLVDFAAVGDGLNAQQEKDLGVHPYFVHVNADQLIGVKYKSSAGGTKALRQIRIKTTQVEEVDQFGEQEVQYIRVINAPTDAVTDDTTGEEIQLAQTGWWELWRFDPKLHVWQILNGPVPHSFPGIPLVTVYLKKVSDHEGRPTIWRLADLNLEHYQKKSDQDNLLHVVRIPILARFGWAAEELAKPITAGAARSIGTTQKDARMEYVEHSGKALGAGQADLDKIEEQMERAGLEPLTRRASSSLATNMMLGDQKETNLLQAWAAVFEVFILQCFEAAATWVKEELPEEFAVDIFNEFGLGAKATESLAALDKARARGDLSHETYLDELKRYAALSTSVDTEEEMARIEQEGPALGLVGLSEAPADPDAPAAPFGAAPPGNEPPEEEEASEEDAASVDAA